MCESSKMKMGFYVILISLIAHLTLSNSETTDSLHGPEHRHINGIREPLRAPSFKVNNLPDFVGFSYSRASLGGPKSRFINFEEEAWKIIY